MGTFYENSQMPLSNTELSKVENVRKSSYTISVKLENEEDKHMLLHGYTGALDIVNGTVINYLENVDLNNDQWQLSEAAVNTLKTRGYLTAKSEKEELEHVQKLANLFHQREKILHKNFLFLVAYDCNFRCPYCYESNILKNSRQWSKKTFTKAMVDKAYETLLNIGGDKKFHSSMITLYGGEPLLAQNKEIVEYIVNKGKDLGYTFMAITNGYDLDGFKDILGTDKIRTLQITVDGIKEKHDQRRIHYQTKKSFDKIIANIGIALEQGTAVLVRVNTDANNFNELEPIEQLFKELGYFDKGKLQMNSALLFEYNNQTTSNKKLNFLNQSEYNKRHKEIAYKYGCTISGVAQILLQTLITKNRVNFASSYCSAQVGSYILDPFGDIYSCWEDVGKIDKIIGHYANTDTDCVEWTEMKNMWHNQNIASSPNCVKCKYAFFCKGGCIAQGEHKTGKFGPGFCNSFPDTFQYAVNLAYSKMLEQNNLNKDKV